MIRSFKKLAKEQIEAGEPIRGFAGVLGIVEGTGGVWIAWQPSSPIWVRH